MYKNIAKSIINIIKNKKKLKIYEKSDAESFFSKFNNQMEKS